MENKHINQKYRSVCCNSRVRVDGGITCWYVCTKCKEPCDIKEI